jgi:hypothetical protein
MLNRIKTVITFGIIILLFTMTVSCKLSGKVSSAEPWNKAIVQVWQPAENGKPAELMSAGLVVGDGSQVLTLLDYENYSTGNLIIITGNNKEYNATFQAVDARTDVTLLKLDGVRLPIVVLSNSSSIPEYGEEVLVWGWSYGSQNTLTSFPGTVSSDQAPRPLFFSIISNGSNSGSEFPGGIVTDKEGKILGLMTLFHETLAITLGGPDTEPPIANIDYARELLNNQDQQYTSLSGPVISAIFSNGGVKGYYGGTLPSPSNYNEMSVALEDLMVKLGKPTETNDLNLSDGWYGNLDGTLLVVVYPRPMELKTMDGKLVGQAKWVGIQWDRNGGQSNRLIYGEIPYTIKGGFEIGGDLTNLQQSVPQINIPGNPWVP